MRDLLGDGGGAAGGGSLVQHVRHQIGQARHGPRVRAVAGAHDHLDSDQRQLVRLGQDHAQTILEAKPFHLRQLERDLLAVGGELVTKLGVRGWAIGKFLGDGLFGDRAFDDGRGCGISRWPGSGREQSTHDRGLVVRFDVDGHARSVAQDLGSPFLQSLGRGRLIAAEIAANVGRIAGEHVVAEEVAGQPLQGIQTAHQIGLDSVARALQLSRLGRLGTQLLQLLVDDRLQLGQGVSLQGDKGNLEGAA